MGHKIKYRGVVISAELKIISRLACLAGVVIVLVAQSLYAGNDSAARQQQRAMELARIGQHDRAIKILQSLKTNYPDRYSIQRDYILVASWIGDCDRVTNGYRSLQKKYQHYSRVVIPVAKCLREQNRVRDAIRILNMALARNKSNRKLKRELSVAQQELSAQKFTTEYELETNSSDAGNREMRGQAIIWGEVGDHLYGHARFTMVYAIDPQFATGNLNRVGVGLDYSMGKLSLDGELSGDIVRGGEIGLSATVRYAPTASWTVAATHHTFSEDVPLRAKALSISSNQRHFAAGFHTPDYVWEWLATADWMSFSDGNRRHEWASELGYGLDLKPEREKRLMFELSQSSNTLGGTVYYNPLSAQTILGGYKLTRVHKSKHKRKSDEIYLWLGDYQQQNYGSNGIYGARYQQDYEFDDAHSFMWRVGAASKVYDGKRESEIEAAVRYTRVLQ
ncbi:MAG: hypothetical protein V3S12_01750 [Acidiferrobacterales bacterium]